MQIYECDKTKEMSWVMTESGMRRCGPEYGVREYKAQGLVQCTKLCRVRRVRAGHGEWYGDWRFVWRYRIEE